MDANVVVVIGANDDGWQHYRVNLAALAPAGSGIAGSGSFNRIIIKDVSGMGFNLVLDNVQLLLGLSNFKVSQEGSPVDFEYNAVQFTAAEGKSMALPPVFGKDLTKVSCITCCAWQYDL
jgi:hypothetical protein